MEEISKKKPVFYSELAYFVGILLTALGTALISAADFGLSMIVAPAYIIHLKLSEFLPFYSFGMSAYVFQAFIIIITAAVMRKFKIYYLFSFITAFLVGIAIDMWLIPVSLIPAELLAVRIALFAAGLISAASGISLLFNTYIPPESYELLVKEFSAKFGFSMGKVKTAYDFSSLVLSLILSFALFGFMEFNGIGIGTLVSAALNGFLIGQAVKLSQKYFTFSDLLPYRKYFSL